jgi:Butirosin biosynthesis protein H, N-terminal/Domain of unknown function (DUF4872)
MSGARTMVPGYEHVPGNHCGSTALRNLLAFHGCEVSEEMAFGLGAGACFFYFPLDGQSPSRFTNGRAARLEENFLELTGAPLVMRTEPEGSWALAREAVDGGRPVVLLTDLYYLDHYGTSAHFPGHAVVLAGYDETDAWLSDTGFEELQSTKLEHLAQARYSKHPAFPLSGQLIELAPNGEGGTLDAERLTGAAPAAIARAAKEMLEPSLAEFEGMPALERLAAEVGAWPETIEDAPWCARFLYQVIERRGTGGGNFRAMYSRFLAEAGYEQTELAAAAASRWTTLAEAARAASEDEQPIPARWAAITAEAERVLESERRLWDALSA